MKEKFKNLLLWAKENKTKASTMLSLALLFVMGITANAEGESGNLDSSMTTALSTAFGAVKADVVSIVTLALPYALGIMAITLSIMIGIKFFKRSAK